MGLDMWLLEIDNLDELTSIIDKQCGLIVLHADDFNADESLAVDSNQVMYWRKANQIHGYFEDVLCDGYLENCSYYEVCLFDLEQLMHLCEETLKILNAKRRVENDEVIYYLSEEDICSINEMLPGIDGFFFGSTDIDDWYRDQLIDTINGLEPIIATMKEHKEYKVFYHAWW